jgi:RNA polymerase sigma factor (sigma-70 family)
LGDAGLAEEVTQNVFIALARKASALRDAATISGWLYKATLLEARHTLRSELRRQRREAVAVELGGATAEGESPWAALVPLLDEGLMKLREDDRLAVLLRYFEEKPFREVGGALGISEDAAQKRVAKSLEALTRFFQRRGFRVSCVGASGAALFARAATSAPVQLATNVARDALAASGSAGLSGLGLLAFKAMNLTKLQIAAACICLAAVPVTYEAYALRTAQRDTSALSAQLAAQQQSLADAEAQRDGLARRLRTTDEWVAGMPARLAAVTPRPRSEPPRWVDSSPFARVPKELLDRVKVNALGRDWRLRKELASILALTPEQFDSAQRALDNFFAEIRALEEAHLERLPPGPETDADGQRAVFRITRYEPEANAARIRLREELRTVLGEARAELAVKYLDFAPARRGVLQPGEPLPEDDFFDEPSHSSDRWNFHGYERTITMVLPRDPTSQPTVTVDMKMGNSGMGFGGDLSMFNPAAAAALKSQWEAFTATRPPLPK